MNDANLKVSITRFRRRPQIRKTSGIGEADVAIAAAGISEAVPVVLTNVVKAVEADEAVRVRASGGNPEAIRLKLAQVVFSPGRRLSGVGIARRAGQTARGETAKAAGTTPEVAILRAAIGKEETLNRELRGR